MKGADQIAASFIVGKPLSELFLCLHGRDFHQCDLPGYLCRADVDARLATAVQYGCPDACHTILREFFVVGSPEVHISILQKPIRMTCFTGLSTHWFSSLWAANKSVLGSTTISGCKPVPLLAPVPLRCSPDPTRPSQIV